MEYIWKKFPEEIIKGDNITESGFNYEEEYENFNNEIEKLIKDFKSKSNKRLPYVGSYPTWIKLL